MEVKNDGYSDFEDSLSFTTLVKYWVWNTQYGYHICSFTLSVSEGGYSTNTSCTLN